MSEEQYKFTKQDCIGCREYCELQQENKMLKLDSKNTYETSQDIMYEMQEKIEELTRLVSNKVMADYDYDSILKQQLNEERLKYVALEESKNIVENILTEFEKSLEEEINNITNTYSQINGNYMRMQPILDTFKECLDKLQELKKEGNK